MAIPNIIYELGTGNLIDPRDFAEGAPQISGTFAIFDGVTAETMVECGDCGLPTPNSIPTLTDSYRCIDCHFRAFPEDWD